MGRLIITEPYSNDEEYRAAFVKATIANSYFFKAILLLLGVLIFSPLLLFWVSGYMFAKIELTLIGVFFLAKLIFKIWKFVGLQAAKTVSIAELKEMAANWD